MLRHGTMRARVAGSRGGAGRRQRAAAALRARRRTTRATTCRRCSSAPRARSPSSPRCGSRWSTRRSGSSRCCSGCPRWLRRSSSSRGARRMLPGLQAAEVFDDAAMELVVASTSRSPHPLAERARRLRARRDGATTSRRSPRRSRTRATSRSPTTPRGGTRSGATARRSTRRSTPRASRTSSTCPCRSRRMAAFAAAARAAVESLGGARDPLGPPRRRQPARQRARARTGRRARSTTPCSRWWPSTAARSARSTASGWPSGASLGLTRTPGGAGGDGGRQARARPAPGILNPGASSEPLVGDQALAAELVVGLGEREVRRREDHVGLLELVLAELAARRCARARASPRRPRGSGPRRRPRRRRPPGCRASLSRSASSSGRRYWSSVAIRTITPGRPGSAAALVGRARPPRGPGDGALPWPSSAFIFARSSSTWLPEVSSASWRSMSSWPAVSVRLSSNAPAASSSSIALARARMPSVLSIARCIASPTSAISSPTPVAASEILTCASAAEYCALMTSFLVRNCSSLERSFCSLSIRPCCWRLELGDLLVERLELGLRELLALERGARELLAAGGERLARLRVELDDLLLELLLLELQPLLRRDDVGDALLDVLQQLHLLRIGVLERLGRILRLVEHLVDLRLDDGGHASAQSGHGYLRVGVFLKRTRPRRRAAAGSEGEGVALDEALAGARHRAPARTGLERRGGDLATSRRDMPATLVSSRRPAMTRRRGPGSCRP